MEIGSVSRGQPLQSAQPLRGVNGPSSNDSRRSAPPLDDSPSNSVTLSQPVELLQKLKVLGDSDPGALKNTLSGMAQQLREAATSAEGSRGARLSEMADRVSQAADSGDLSLLTPPPKDGPAAAESVTGLPARALEAYAKNGPPAPSPEDIPNEVIGAMVTRIDQAIASTQLSSLSAGTGEIRPRE